MALSDPQSVTISGTATSLARTDLAKNKGSFISSTGQVEMTISSTFNAKTGASTLVRLNLKKTAADPVTGVTTSNVASVWFVCRRPDSGFFTAAELSGLATALSTYISGTNFPRILVGEA